MPRRSVRWTAASAGGLLSGLFIAAVVALGYVRADGTVGASVRAAPSVPATTGARAGNPSYVGDPSRVDNITRIDPVSVLIVPDDPHSDADLTRGVGGLAPDSVLAIDAIGFPPDTTAVAEQCETGADPLCRNSLRVRLDDHGRAFFQYLVHQLADGRCTADRPRCFVRLRTGDHSGTATLVFDDAMPTLGHITVRPRVGVRSGDTVTVTATGFPPGVVVSGRLCAPPHRSDDRGCAPVGPEATATIDANGSGSLRVVVRSGRLGDDRLPCDRRSRCVIAVAGEGLAANAPPVAVAFAGPAGADYDTGRTVGGLALAALLLFSAWLLVRRTDWAPVGEVAAPEIDQSEYADLDAMVAEAEALDAARAQAAARD